MKMLTRKSLIPIRSRALAIGQIALVIRSDPESMSSTVWRCSGIKESEFKAVAGLRNCLLSETPQCISSQIVRLRGGISSGARHA